ncbi:hypothetical protein C7974DRAFT_400954 [Boeremia exigua]|uniref:uncharacterized protein n=1 Tax=Boeremia exigua TaxID=749465 RepID=UPI001E8E09FA|nr:uncharacterized protein C7974DRAFT_400954 [Boeremia exigua]KAH6618815.1 hypothetical protein C7974DRAFT_400954 [Boeremia exigua]
MPSTASSRGSLEERRANFGAPLRSLPALSHSVLHIVACLATEPLQVVLLVCVICTVITSTSALHGRTDHAGATFATSHYTSVKLNSCTSHLRPSQTSPGFRQCSSMNCTDVAGVWYAGRCRKKTVKNPICALHSHHISASREGSPQSRIAGQSTWASPCLLMASPRPPR